MIKKNKNQIEMQFGTGDIGFNSGAYVDKNKKIGIAAFYNQMPREIGSVADIKAGTKVDINTFPVIMTFYKRESIDALIQSLLEAKKEME